jgi:hypothetical protein
MNRVSIQGWISVGICTLFSSVWAFWGAFESFHEGWYFRSLGDNLFLTFKYLALALLFTAFSVIPLGWPRIGATLYLLFTIAFCIWIYATREALSLEVVIGWLPAVVAPLIAGILFWAGRPKPRILALAISLFLPLIVSLGFSVEPIIRIAGRSDDGFRGARTVQGNGVRLVWAPEGPGWHNPNPHDELWVKEWRGPTWEEARKACRYLTADGKSLASTPQDIWRLPTADELVRSMTRHGTNCGGRWISSPGLPLYTTKPDKEAPLWNPYSPVIYYWTSSERNDDRAYSISFEGTVWTRNKSSTLGSIGFRAVRLPPASPILSY